MPKTRVSKANGLKKDSQGFVTGTLISVEENSSEFTDSKSGLKEEVSQIEWVFEVETKKEGKSTNLHTWSSMSLNTQKYWYEEGKDSKPQYNKLTQLVLASKLLSVKQIEEIEAGGETDIDLESLIGKSYRFLTRPKPGKGSLEEIIISTVEIID